MSRNPAHPACGTESPNKLLNRVEARASVCHFRISSLIVADQTLGPVRIPEKVILEPAFFYAPRPGIAVYKVTDLHEDRRMNLTEQQKNYARLGTATFVAAMIGISAYFVQCTDSSPVDPSPGVTPSPSSSPSSLPSPSVTPSATPAPSQTPPVPTPTMTILPIPTATPSKTPTPIPSATVTATPTASPTPSFSPVPQPSVTPTPAATKLRGTNLGNTELAYYSFPQATGPVESQNYPKYDTKLIDYFSSKHVTALRYLFSWEGMQATQGSAIPGASGYGIYFENYKRIVDYATSKGITVIIEPWDSNSSGGAGGIMFRGALPTAAQFSDFWKRMATNFATNPRVMFGLINEPNNTSTMGWFALAQAGINGIRGAGAGQRIFVCGNGWSNASTWTSNWYDTDAIKRSNAYGWLNANGVGKPLSDPQNNLAAEVHTYLDANQGGGAPDITSVTAARKQLAPAVNEARAHGYKVFLGEMGMYAGATTADGHPASDAWADFQSYYHANEDVMLGWTWFAAGMPGWWDDVAANGGGHFSISPTSKTTFTGDTVNMTMIQGDF